MFREEIDMAGNAAKKKIQFLRQQTGAYFISAMLAGMFVDLAFFWHLQQVEC